MVASRRHDGLNDEVPSPLMADKASVAPPEPARHLTVRNWAFFVVQISAVGIVQGSNDLIRGNLWPPSVAEAERDARNLVDLERTFGLYVEPGIQTFFQHAHSLLGLTITWPLVEQVANSLYAVCHIAVTLLVAIWVFVSHRRWFPLLRNVAFLTSLAALAGYEVYPTAPPRLTTGLIWDGRSFHFIDTMQHIIGTGKLNGSALGYNPYSAMPSLHVAWALIMGITIVLLARNLLVRVLGVLYPVIITVVTVVTGNHWVMDAVGAALCVAIAGAVALLIEHRQAERRTAGSALGVP